MHALRTPEDRFAAVPDFPYPPRYVDVSSGDGGVLRIAYVEAGPPDAPVVLALHGEPSWSFLYRKVMRVVAAGGLRVVAPDLIGFGRSDKPAAREDYSYARHVAWLRAFVDSTQLRAITLLCQDWGGLLGLRLVGEEPQRFARVIAANTFLPTGDQTPSAAFTAWRQFSQTVPELPVSRIVATGCARPLTPEVLAAYDAPFPDETYKAGARAFPMLVPTSPDDPAAEPNRRAWVKLAAFERPFVTAFGDSDPITRGADARFHELIAGTRGRPHVTLGNAGHFLQEDVGDELGQLVLDVVAATPEAVSGLP